MTKKELYESRWKKIPIPSYDQSIEHRFFNGIDLNDNKRADFVYGDINVKVGQFFLYEATINDHLYYPKLALFVKYGIIDMAVNAQFIDVERSWEWKLEYEQEYKDFKGEKMIAKVNPAEDDAEIKNLILWNDSMDVYGAWDKMPTWKELKVAYQKTVWFSRSIEDKRDIYLRSIL